MSKRAALHRSPLGWHASNLVCARGTDPEGAVFELIRRDSDDQRAAETLISGLVEAATERELETSVERCTLSPGGAIRGLTSPPARRVLAVWCVLAEYVRNHIANSKSLWHEAIARRLRCSVSSVERALNALQASGVLKQWQPPRKASGVVKTADGHCYSQYLLFHVPRAVVRTVRDFWEKRRAPAPRPESVPRASAVPHVQAPAVVLPPSPGPAPPDIGDDGAHEAMYAALERLGLTLG